MIFIKRELMTSYMKMKLKLRINLRTFKFTLFYLLLGFLLTAGYVLGIQEYLMATAFDQFSYPLHVDITEVIRKVKNGETLNLQRLNNPSFNIIHENKGKCQDVNHHAFLQLRILFVVKSAVPNFKLREMIRKTWGYEKRFSDVPIRTIFVIGVDKYGRYNQQDVELENAKYHDILQGDFIDSYFNNTLKTMLSLAWARDNCKGVTVFAFIDDDYYVSTKNLLKYLRNYRNVTGHHKHSFKDERFFGGYVFPDSVPQRFKFSKWYISLEEYSYSRWPPYVTGGAYLLSYSALNDLVITSHYTKKFRFDDIYLGILAARANISLTHINNFHFWSQSYNKVKFKDTIATHGFKDPKKLEDAWYEQRTFGDA